MRIHKTGKKSHIYTTKRLNHENRMIQEMDTNTDTDQDRNTDMVTEWKGTGATDQIQGYMAFFPLLLLFRAISSDMIHL